MSDNLSTAAGFATGLGTDHALPLYVQRHGARVTKDGGRVVVNPPDDDRVTVRLEDVSQLVMFGNATITTPCLHALMRSDIPVAWHAASGWFVGFTKGLGHADVAIRRAQFAAVDDPTTVHGVAQRLIVAKLRNARARLRRRLSGVRGGITLRRLSRLADRAESATDIGTLRGIEGAAGRIYFAGFGDALKPPRRADRYALKFRRRQRRPPPDPINAMLSFAYAMLLRETVVALTGEGLEPMLGFHHGSAHGRPALALDLMEPFRPLIADAAVLAVVNNGRMGNGDFRQEDAGTWLGEAARRVVIAEVEARLDQTTTPAHLGFALSHRRLIALQARLLARYLQGERPDFPQHVAR